MALKKYKAVFFLLLLLFAGQVLAVPFAQGLGESAPVVDEKAIDKIITVVNDDIITRNELLSEIKFVIKQLRQQQTPLPPADVLQNQILDRMILKRLQLQMAQRARIRIDDETLNQNILNIASSNNMSLSQFRRALENDGFEFSKYRKTIREEITISRLRQRQVNNRVTVTDQEIKDFLATRAIQGGLDDEYNIAHILIEVPEAASSEQVQQSKAKAQQVLEKINSGEEFSSVAASYSDGQLALEGGGLGWRKLGQLPVLFSNVITGMKISDVKGLIRSPSGFHIIKLIDKRTNERKNIIQQTRPRHILMKTNQLVSDKEALDKLEQISNRLKLGGNFTEIARANSDDTTSAAKGGELGWVSPGDLVPKFEKIMNETNINEISKPFKTQFGWHIVQVLERREFDNTEKSIKLSARNQIMQRKIEEETRNWLRRLRDEAYVEVRI